MIEYTALILHHLGHRDEAQRYLEDFVARLPIRVELETTGRASAVFEEAD